METPTAPAPLIPAPLLPAALSPAQAALLVLRREWLTRRAWLVLLLVAEGMIIGLEGEKQAAWSLFLLLLVVPVVAFGLGATRDPTADRYWASFAGPPWARATARILVHVGIVTVLVGSAAVALAAGSEGDPLTSRIVLAGSVWLGSSTLYAAIGLARRTASPTEAVAAPLVVALLLAAGAWMDLAIGKWTAVEGVAIRAVLLLGGALAAQVAWEGRLTRPREELRVVGGAALLVLLVTGGHLAWSGRPLLLADGSVRAAQADGSAFLYIPWRPDDPQGAGPGDRVLAAVTTTRAVVWRRRGGFAAVGPSEPAWGAFLPGGAVALAYDEPSAWIWLGDEHGEIARIPVDQGEPEYGGTAPDGSLAILLSGPDPDELLILHTDGHTERGPATFERYADCGVTPRRSDRFRQGHRLGEDASRTWCYPEVVRADVVGDRLVAVTGEAWGAAGLRALEAYGHPVAGFLVRGAPDHPFVLTDDALCDLHADAPADCHAFTLAGALLGENAP